MSSPSAAICVKSAKYLHSHMIQNGNIACFCLCFSKYLLCTWTVHVYVCMRRHPTRTMLVDRKLLTVFSWHENNVTNEWWWFGKQWVRSIPEWNNFHIKETLLNILFSLVRKLSHYKLMVILSGAYNNVTYYLNAALSSVITSFNKTRKNTGVITC